MNIMKMSIMKPVLFKYQTIITYPHSSSCRFWEKKAMEGSQSYAD